LKDALFVYNFEDSWFNWLKWPNFTVYDGVIKMGDWWTIVKCGIIQVSW
jgi:hypothetical protein